MSDTAALGSADPASHGAERVYTAVPDDARGAGRVLIVVNDTRFFACHCAALVAAARRLGLEVHLAAMDFGDLDVVRSQGCIYHPLRMSRTGTNPARDLGLLWQLLRIIRAVRPILVQTVTIKPMIYGGITARLLRVPALVSTVAGLGFVFEGSGQYRRLLQALVKKLYRIAFAHGNSCVVFQNEWDRADFVEARLVDPARTTVIRGFGADLRIFQPHPEPPGVPVVLLPARLLREKGILEFVAAARLIKKRGCDARFVLVGDHQADNPGSIPRPQLECWLAEGVVEWLGYRTDMAKVYAASHIVCLPSFREGLSKSLIEAAACQRAIVTTDVPGCRDVVRDGDTGFLVKPRSPEALAKALLTLLQDPERRQAMGRRGRARAVAEFSLEEAAARTADVYRGLCSPSLAAEHGRAANIW